MRCAHINNHIEQMHLSHAGGTVAQFSIKLFRIDGALNGYTILVEHTVGTDFMATLRFCSCIEINAEQRREQQIHRAKPQFDCNQIAGGPKAEIQKPRNIFECF